MVEQTRWGTDVVVLGSLCEPGPLETVDAVPVAAPTAPSTAPISAADDESPDPISTSLVIDIAPPGTGWPAPRSAQIAPAA